MKTRDITVEVSKDAPVACNAVEIVERKGTGHPDYICDAVADRISVELSREYIRRFGRVLHHNIDKGLLVAGAVSKRWGGGRVISPMELIIGDRATFKYNGLKVPVADIAVTAAKGWFKENLPRVNVEKDINFNVALAPGSTELSGIFARKGKTLGANDTSAAVGYAPFTATEKTVFETERFLNSPAFKLRFPETGEDVKVMGVRRGSELDVTIACPLNCRLVKDEQDYFRRKKMVHAALTDFLSDTPFKRVSLGINTLDKKGVGINGVYMTMLGTSAEDADSGEVGRGNRVNGVISLNRPMGTEAAAGKNPVSHVGKIYTVLAHRMAAELFIRLGNAAEVYVWLLSRVGAPIDKPHRIYVKIIPLKGFNSVTAKKSAAVIIDEFMQGINAFTAELARGEYPVC
ncbi:methionine adenosyltransferase [bacterium]|nr:MAG: methionine adenosyltransferase [bacterium]